MQNLYGMNDWGILVTNDEREKGIGNLSPVELRDLLSETEFERIEPLAGTIYMDESGEYLEASQPIWFMPVAQPGLFDAPYEDMEDLEDEFKRNYPELAALLPVESRLCKLNIVAVKEENHG